MNLILNKEQARAIADAMLALNNVDMKLKAEIGNANQDMINCFEMPNGSIRVNRVYHFRLMEEEIYSSQDAFCVAYNVTF